MYRPRYNTTKRVAQKIRTVKKQLNRTTSRSKKRTIYKRFAQFLVARGVNKKAQATILNGVGALATVGALYVGYKALKPMTVKKSTNLARAPAPAPARAPAPAPAPARAPAPAPARAPAQTQQQREFDAYINKMQRAGEWGGQVEIAAAANRYNRIIYVHRQSSQNVTQHQPIYTNNHTTAIHLFHDGNHYKILVPKNENPQCTEDLPYQFDNKSWCVINSIGDGNCLYRCISYAIYKNENSHMIVRNQIVAYMMMNRSNYDAGVLSDDISEGF
jgi:hypothetical protein